MKKMIHICALLTLGFAAYAENLEQDFTQATSTEEATAPKHKKSRQSIDDRLYHIERKMDGLKTATAEIPSREDLNRLENKIDQLTNDILALRSEKSASMDLDSLDKIDLGAPLAIEIAEIAMAPEQNIVMAQEEPQPLAQETETH